MSTRYQFEDDSAVVRLAGFLEPDPTAGGTFTGPVTIAPPLSLGNSPSLVVESSSTKDDGNDTFDVADSTGLNVYTVYADGSSTYRLQFNGSTLLAGNPGGTPNTLTVTGANTIGFFGGTAAARQTLVSGTATPEQIALALQASTLMGGS